MGGGGWGGSRSRRLVLLAAAVFSLSVDPSLRAQDADLSYAVADSGDTLVEINRFDGTAFRVIGNCGTTLIEAISWNLGATKLQIDAPPPSSPIGRIRSDQAVVVHRNGVRNPAGLTISGGTIPLHFRQ